MPSDSTSWTTYVPSVQGLEELVVLLHGSRDGVHHSVETQMRHQFPGFLVIANANNTHLVSFMT